MTEPTPSPIRLTSQSSPRQYAQGIHAQLDTKLLERVVGGDVAAWQTLWSTATPLIIRRIRRHSMMKSRFAKLWENDCDYVLDVCQRVFERLAKHEHRNIKQYLDGARSLPSSSFAAWLMRLTDFVVREYLTEKYGVSRVNTRAEQGEPGANGHAGLHKRDAGSFAARLVDDDPALIRSTRLSSVLTARKLIEYARDTFTAAEWSCLERYLIGHSYAEIAELEQLPDERTAEITIRKLKQRLRSELEDGRVNRHQTSSQSGSNIA